MVKIAESLQIFILVSTAHPKIPIWRPDSLASRESTGMFSLLNVHYLGHYVGALMYSK